MCGLGEGEEIARRRYRQIDDAPDAAPEQVLITVKQPLAIQAYYDGAGIIDGMNRLRAAELRLDRNFGTKEWHKRFNLGVFGIHVCDTYALFQGVVHPKNRASCPREFFCLLADGLIENTEGVRASRSSSGSTASAAAAAPAAQPKLRFTLRFKQCGKRHGQGRCRNPDCQSESSWVCDTCTHATDKDQKQCWICAKPDKDCWAKHLKEVHGIE